MAGHVGIALSSLHGDVASIDAGTPHYPASTIKLAVLATILRSGRVGSLDTAIGIHDRFAGAAGGSFMLQQADDQDDETWARLGTQMLLLDLAERMITVSGNLATDLLLEHLGFDVVRDFLADAGLAHAIGIERLIGDVAAEDSGITNTVTAGGLAALMAGIADGSLLGAPASEVALGMLARQEHRGMIPAGLPPGTWSASKGGWVPGVAHDVALVRPVAAPPYVLAVCTTTNLPTADGEALVARLSTITWEHWIAWHA